MTVRRALGWILLAASLAVPLAVPGAGAAQDLSALVDPGGGEATATEGPLSAEVDPALDAAIARGLEERLGQFEELRQIEVEVTAGVVRLSGEALSRQARDEAARLARRVEGVVQVNNRIEVVQEIPDRVVPVFERLEERLFGFVEALPLVLIALGVFFLFWLLARGVDHLERPFERLTQNRFLQDQARQATRLILLVIGALLAVQILELEALVGALLGGVGLVGIALGFAFRDMAENSIASVLLSLRQPFAPNDHVVIDGEEGKVVRLTSRATILMTLSGNHLRIPNATVFKAKILNYTANPLRRFELGVGVGVNEDLTEARRLGVEVLRTVEGVLEDPQPWAEVAELGESNVLVRFYGWVDQRQASFTQVRSQAVAQVKGALDDAGIDMPEPIYRVHLSQGAAPAEEPEPPERPFRKDAAPLPDPDQQVTKEDAVDRQIAAERAQVSGEQDLLSYDAPRE